MPVIDVLALIHNISPLPPPPLQHQHQKKEKILTNGTPQYPQTAISGLSVLMYTRGCPAAPTSPPPSHATTRSCVHRTGSLWISSMAAYGCGYVSQLAKTIPAISPPSYPRGWVGEVVPHTCNSKSVCSNLGPTMASARGFWLRDQISARFGACAVGAAGTGAGVTGLLSAASCVVWAVVVGEEDAVDEWRRVRTAARRGSAARRRVAAAVSMVGWWGGASIEGWLLLRGAGEVPWW